MPDEVPWSLPLHAGVDVPGHRVSLHAVLVRGGTAHFDDAALHGASGVEAGVRWSGRREELAAPERWWVVWVAAIHEPDGTRAYAGAVACELWVDRAAGRGYRDPGGYARAQEEAQRGRVALDALGPEERDALRRALLVQDADAWDRADERLRRALGR